MIRQYTSFSIPAILLSGLITLLGQACSSPPGEAGSAGPRIGRYVPLAGMLRVADGPLAEGKSRGARRRRVFQSAELKAGRMHVTPRIGDAGWFTLRPDGAQARRPPVEASPGIISLGPRDRGETLFLRADFSTRAVDLVAIGVESREPGRFTFLWDRLDDGELLFNDGCPVDFEGGEGVREVLVPLRRTPGWQGRLRAVGVRPGALPSDLVIHYLRFIRSGLVDTLRLDQGQRGTVHGRLSLGDESRSTIFAPSGTVLETVVEVPGGAVLAAGYGVAPPARRVTGAAASFSVEVEEAGKPARTLFAARLAAGSEDRRQWHDFRVDLDEFRGREVTVRMITGGDPAQADGGAGPSADRFGDHAAWSDPAIVCLGSRSGPGRRNVILLVMDALRADRLSCFGAPRRTSPHFDRLASHAHFFTVAASQASWTGASVGSLFTSLYPSRHGAERHLEPLSSERLTLAEMLAGSGFHTAGFVANITVSGLLNFDQGFDRYTYVRAEKPLPYAAAGPLYARVLPWLEANADRPFFLYIHTMDPHSPYIADPPYRRLFDESGMDDRQFEAATRRLRSVKLGGRALELERYVDTLYDGEIAYGDYFLGLLMARLAELGLRENTAVIVTSDHGEELFDHGDWGHGKTLFGEVVGVPLAVSLPAGMDAPAAGSLGRRPARLVDLAPTVLEILGVEPPPGGTGDMAGRSLLGRPAVQPLYAETNKGRHLLYSVRLEGFAFIRRFEPVREDVLYDLGADPAERVNVIEDYPEVAHRLAAWGDAVWSGRRAGRRATAVPDAETESRLRALGYIE